MPALRPLLLLVALVLGGCSLYSDDPAPMPEPQPDPVAVALEGCERMCTRLEDPSDASGLGCLDVCSVEIVEQLR